MMSEIDAEEIQHDVPPSRDESNRVTIAVIVGIVIVVLACLAACTVVALVFFINAPWRF